MYVFTTKEVKATKLSASVLFFIEYLTNVIRWNLKKWLISSPGWAECEMTDKIVVLSIELH